MSIPITKEGRDRLQAELDAQRNVERHKIVKAIAEARAHGDLSENAEYHSAKDKQGMIEARIKELESVLGAAQVIDPTAVDAGGRCIFGSYVVLEDKDGGKKEYRIVSQYEANAEGGLLSSTSPLGRALIGKNKKDRVEVQAPSGVREYVILDVRYQ